MSNYNSTEEAARATLGVLGLGRYGKQVPMLLPFNWTVPTSPGSAPTVNLCKVPAGFIPRLIDFRTDGLSASAGINLLVRIGDQGDGTNGANDARLMADVDSDVAGASYTGLAAAAFNFEYLADTVIVATVNSGKTPVAGKLISGFILGSVRQAT